MKKIVFLIITILSVSNVYSQPGKYWERYWYKLNKHPTLQIIEGCLLTGLGCNAISEAISDQNGHYNYGQLNPPNYSSIILASLGGGTVCYGTFLIIHGIKVNREQKLRIGITQNGIGLIYKLN
jgi:hypothetical protein